MWIFQSYTFFLPDLPEGHLPGELAVGRLLAAHDATLAGLIGVQPGQGTYQTVPCNANMIKSLENARKLSQYLF